ncbi:MAG: DUF11 domain-containing protein [Anaerolineae bacterium]|nr:DUF11 domain-containing protein [Anaerolineae bacterium]
MTNRRMAKRATYRPLKILLVILLWFVAVIGVAYAIELPAPDSEAFLQTTGPNAGLGVGDFYTNVAGANESHFVEINVPCSWPDSLPITFALFDPESTGGTFAGPPPVVDEQRGGSDDDTTFSLIAPDGTDVASQVYTPAGGSDGLWVELATISTTDFGCGIYTLETSTADDDDNAWRLKVNNDDDCTVSVPNAGTCSGISVANSDLLSNATENDDPDGFPGSGDELEIGLVQSSFQHLGAGEPCQDFYFFVDGLTSPLTLNNFDMDNAGSVTYFLPDGSEVDGTVSGGTVWNNSTNTTRGGDVFDIDSSLVGWWRAEVCIPEDNQYIFEGQEGEPIYFSQPGTPVMIVSKDDGKTVVANGETITHTIVFTNVSDTTSTPGTAANVSLVDNLPDGLTFQSCDIAALEAAYPGSTCTPTSASEVTVVVGGNVLPGQGGSFNIIVTVDADASDTLTNTVTLNYSDPLGNPFAPVQAIDETLIPPDLTLVKSDGGITTGPGETVVYTLDYANVSNTGATGVAISETVPDNTTFNDAASTPGWVCVGTACTYTLNDVPGNSSGSIDFAVDVDNPLPANVTLINNSASITDDGLHGPDPTPENNVTSDNTPIGTSDPQIIKAVNPAQAEIGDTVNFSIIVSNPSANSTVPATNVVLTDPLPQEYNFVSYSLSSAPSGVVANGSEDSQVITIVGHPSGITQTVVTTITVDIPTLGLDESVTLSVVAKVNGLAVPRPFNIVNQATLEFDGGPPKVAEARVVVPAPSKNDTPDTNESKDDDDDDGSVPSTSPPSVSVPATPVPPTPAPLPVLLLPETGLKDVSAPISPTVVGVWSLVGVVSVALALLYGYKRKDRKSK